MKRWCFAQQAPLPNDSWVCEETSLAPPLETWLRNQRFWQYVSAKQQGVCCRDLGARSNSAGARRALPSQGRRILVVGAVEGVSQQRPPHCHQLLVKLLFVIFSSASSALRDARA